MVLEPLGKMRRKIHSMFIPMYLKIYVGRSTFSGITDHYFCLRALYWVGGIAQW
jgi:hypothetical protein